MEKRSKRRAVFGNALLAVAALAGSYIFASLAIDSGHILEYLAAITLFIFAINRSVQAIKRIRRYHD